MPVRRPQVQVTINGGAAAGLLRLDLVSSGAGLRAALTLPARAPRHAIGAGVTVSIGGTVVFTGPIHAAEPVRRSMRRYLAEPLSSQMLRGLAAGLAGPFAWRRGASRAMAAEVLTGLPHDLAALPAADLRWSAPQAPRRWLLDSLLRAVAGAAGTELDHLIRAGDGTVALGPAADLRWPSGAALRTGETILRRRGDRYVTLAAPVLAGATVRVDGADRVCHHARLEVRAGRYRSHLLLREAAP